MSDLTHVPPPGAEALPPAFSDSGRFQPRGMLGRGSMGVVYRVYDAEMDVDVALKTLPAHDPEQLYRLKQEFRVLSGIVHPNLVQLYDLVASGRECFFTMELIDGIGFTEYVRQGLAEGEPLPAAALPRLLAAARQLVIGLAAVHASGKLHRDVKPSNVLVSREGRVCLLDFGLATALGVDADGGMAGTLAYMAPEQIWGSVPQPAGDWYSVGVLLYEALIGRLPFDSSGARLLQDKQRSAPPSVRALAPRLPESIDSLVSALLDPNPARRPDHRAILACLSAEPGSGRAFVDDSTASSAEVPFVGRTAELARLQRVFEDVRKGDPALVRLYGPSGIGKTELVRRFVHALERDSEALVLRGRCHPQEAIPYKALDRLVDGLSRALMSLPTSTVSSVVPQHASALLRVFPVLGRVAALGELRDQGILAAEPHEIRRRGFNALRELLTNLSRDHPLVLWIDDLQWGDLDSAAVLRELLRPPAVPRMLVLVSYRSEDRGTVLLPEVSENRAGAQASVSVHDVELGPLTPLETHQLAESLCAVQIESDRRIADIVADSAGSPFLIAELTRARPTGQAPATRGLTELLTQRVQQLPEVARRVLELVSVAGTPLERSVALAAAGIGERGRPAVMQLEHRSLLRTTTFNERTAIEVYHDRIREALLASVSAETLRSRHGALADVLEGQPRADPDALFRHCLGAGRQERAADWAVQAAEHADGALAFQRAAELYGRALELKAWDEPRAVVLQVQRADALVNAGRGAEAAPLYLDVVPRVATGDRLDLRRRAAEQYLLSGHMDKGTAVVRAVLDEVGVRNPRSPTAALVGTVARIVPLWVRDTRISRRVASRLSPAQLKRIDACHSAAKGLALVDPIRALYFAVLSLALALRSGDPLRIALERASVGVALLPVRGPLARWAARLILDARAVAETSGDPYLLGFTAITMAQMRMVEARWREMLEFCDTASALLRQHCRGITWELDISCSAATRALEELGEIHEMAQRGERLLRDTEETSNLYGRVNGFLLRGLGRLTEDDPAEARALARRVRSLWTAGGFSMQSFYAFRLEAYCDLYEGRPHVAWNRVERTWPEIRRSGLLQHTLLRSDAYLLRARAALVVASSAPSQREAMLRSAEADAMRIARTGRPDANAHALLVCAGMAAIRGERPRTADLLTQATIRFKEAGMALCVAVARRRAAELCGGIEGQELLCQADEFFSREAISNPTRFLAMYAPGFPERDVNVPCL